MQEQETFLRVLDFTGLEVNKGTFQRGLRPQEARLPTIRGVSGFREE